MLKVKSSCFINSVCLLSGIGIKQTIQRAVESVGIMGVESQRISGRNQFQSR